MEGTLRQLDSTKRARHSEEDTYHVLGRDPITEVFGKEHGGRTKGVSTILGVRTALGWVKGDKERHHVMIEGLKAIVAHLEGRESPTCLDSSCASDKFDDLEDPAPCDLLWPYGPDEFRVAIGKVYPTRDATLHGSSITETWYTKRHNEQFATWLNDKVAANMGQPNVDITSCRVNAGRKSNAIRTPNAIRGLYELLESQGALLPPIPTSWPQMVEQPMSSHPSTTEPVEQDKP
ncbi:hypothetical protein Tco_1205222 [Tanacetum coccineum]